MGRVFYTPELGDLICERIAEGESLRSICSREDFPSVGGFLGWVAKSERGDEQFAGLVEQYTRAMEQRTECLGEDLLEIADDAKADYAEDPETGAMRFQAEAVQRARLRIDTRKWLMGKMKPKKYGEKVTQEHTGPNGGPIQTQGVPLSAADVKSISSALEDEC